MPAALDAGVEFLEAIVGDPARAVADILVNKYPRLPHMTCVFTRHAAYTPQFYASSLS